MTLVHITQLKIIIVITGNAQKHVGIPSFTLYNICEYRHYCDLSLQCHVANTNFESVDPSILKSIFIN